MRIFFTGAQGTGKSTLVRALHDKLPELTMHDSMSKHFMTSKQEQFESDFQLRLSLWCLNMYVNERDFICSRSYFDSLAYPEHSGSLDSESTNRVLDMVRLYEPLVFQEDCIYFYVPIEFELSDDGNPLRDTNKEYQEVIDRSIRAHIDASSHKDRIYGISGDVDSRVKQVLNIINYRKELSNICR